MKLEKVIERLDVRNSDLSGSVFDDVNLSGASLNNVNMAGWIVDNVNLAGLRLTNANLAGVRISGCRNSDTMTIDGVTVAELFAAYQATRVPKPPDAG